MTVIAQSQEASKGSFWGATFLISGTCIGGGMLAMPIQTAKAGLFLSVLALFVSWLFMTFTGLLLVEVTSWFKNEAHFASMSRKLAGQSIKALAMIVYLFMNYTSLIAYTSGGAALINSWLNTFFHIDLGYNISCCLFVMLFGLVVFLGMQFVGRINTLLMLALSLVYVGLVGVGISIVDSGKLIPYFPWREGVPVFSIILATFSYQMVVPSVCSYLNYDEKMLKRAVIVGTTIPLIVYSLWLFVIHGVIPLEGKDSLMEALSAGHAVTVPLRARFSHWILLFLADSFAFFAVVTSFLGLSLALFQFLNDSFKEIKISLNRNTVLLLTFVPTLLLAIFFPKALLQCLDMSGGYGDTILSGLIPIILIFAGRYQQKIQGEFRIPGGRIALGFAFVFYFTVLLSQFITI